MRSAVRTDEAASMIQLRIYASESLWLGDLVWVIHEELSSASSSSSSQSSRRPRPLDRWPQGAKSRAASSLRRASVLLLTVYHLGRTSEVSGTALKDREGASMICEGMLSDRVQ
ncbi:hypothetical protein VTO73DRAFT_9616 [Trametes versicolor]